MIKFFETAEGESFIASAGARETSVEIMKAIAGFARNLDEAESLWAGDGVGRVATIVDLIEVVTNNGRRGEPSDYVWGAAGSSWAE